MSKTRGGSAHQRKPPPAVTNQKQKLIVLIHTKNDSGYWSYRSVVGFLKQWLGHFLDVRGLASDSKQGVGAHGAGLTVPSGAESNKQFLMGYLI